MGSKKRRRIRNAQRPPLRFIRVTTTTLYCFEEGSINGWHPEEVVEHWFQNYPIDSHHASREAHQLGGSAVVKTAKVVTSKQANQHLEEVKTFHKELKEKKERKEKEFEEMKK